MNEKKGQWLFGNKNSSTGVKIMRWIARVWGVVALTMGLLIVFGPDPHAVNPIKPREVFMLSVWLIAFLGLIVAWRWEQIGALITIFTMPVRELIYVLIYREWTVNFLLIWVVVIPPAVMYLLAWRSDRKQEVLQNTSTN